MGQAEIIKLLERKNRWVSTNEMAENLEEAKSSISSRLKTLLKNNEVLRRNSKFKGTSKSGKVISYNQHEYKINPETKDSAVRISKL